MSLAQHYRVDCYSLDALACQGRTVYTDPLGRQLRLNDLALEGGWLMETNRSNA